MPFDVIDRLNKIDKPVLYCLTAIAICLAAPTGIGLMTILLRSNNFSFERGDTKIKVQGEIVRYAINNDAYSNKQLIEKVEELESIVNRSNTPTEVKQAVRELKPTARAVVQTSEELQEIAEETVEERVPK